MVIAIAGHDRSLWVGLELWCACGVLLETATDTTSAAIAAWCSAVVALLVVI
jgi:hypothetical protein